MNLTDLKKMPAAELVALAQSMNVEGTARSRKQDIIFAILKHVAKNGDEIFGDGVMEIMQDGYGFLRSGDSSIWPAPMTFMSRRARSDASICAPETPSPGESAHPRKASATSRC